VTKEFFQSITKHRVKDIHGIQSNFHDYLRVKTIYFISTKSISCTQNKTEQNQCNTINFAINVVITLIIIALLIIFIVLSEHSWRVLTFNTKCVKHTIQ